MDNTTKTKDQLEELSQMVRDVMEPLTDEEKAVAMAFAKGMAAQRVIDQQRAEKTA